MLQTLFPSGGDTSSAFGAPTPYLADMVTQQQDAAMRNNQMNQDLQQQLYNQNEQMNPLLLQQQGLQNQSLEAQIPGFQAQSDLARTHADIASALKDSDIQAKISANWTAMSDDQRKQQANAIFNGMIDPSPAVRQQSNMLFMGMPEQVQTAVKELYMQNRELAVTKQQGENAENLANINNAAGRYGKNSLDYLMMHAETSGNLQQQAGVYRMKAQQYATQAYQEQDPTARSQMLEMAKYYSDLSEARIKQDLAAKSAPANAANATKPNVPALLDQTQGSANPPVSSPTLPGVQPSQQQGGLQAPGSATYTPQQQSWIQAAQQRNPGMSIEQIIQEGKKRGKL